MNPANYELIKSGQNVLQTDITKEMFINLIQRSIDKYWDLTELKKFDFKNTINRYITFGGGVLVASDVERSELRIKLASQFEKIFPTISLNYKRNENTSYLNGVIDKFIGTNTPKGCTETPIQIKFYPWELEAAAIIFSFMILDINWMYFDVDAEEIKFKPIIENEMKIGMKQKNVSGFSIQSVGCGVGIFRPGIQVTRFKINNIRNNYDYKSESNERGRLRDVWNQHNKRYSKLLAESAYLHIFHSVDSLDMESIDSDTDFKYIDNNSEKIFDQNKKYLLAKPIMKNMTRESFSELSKYVFEPEGVLDQSLRLDLPKKLVNFTMPNVEIDAIEEINEANAKEYGIPESCFSRSLQNLISSKGHLGLVKSMSKLKINKEGVALSAVTCGLACDGCNDNLHYDVDIDQPFCFAITIGDYVLAKGAFAGPEE